MKYTLIKNVPKNNLLKVVPRQLINYISLNTIKHDLVDLIIFPSDKKKVVVSGQIIPALKQTNELHPLLVVGYSFTVDAAKIAREHTEYFFCRDDSFWTDQSYENIKVSISKRSKL